VKHARYYWLLAESHSDAALLWSHAEPNRNSTLAGGVAEPQTGAVSGTSEAGEGRVSEASLREAAILGFEALGRGGTGSVRGRREHRNAD